MKSLIILAIKMKPAAGALARIVGKPTSEIGIGALLLGLGLYLSLATAAVPTLMALGGCAALAAGTLQLRRRKERQIAVSRKRMMGLIATGGVFLTGGVLTMFEAAPFVSLLILAGTGCAGLGIIRIRMKRRYKQLRSAEKRIEVW